MAGAPPAALREMRMPVEQWRRDAMTNDTTPDLRLTLNIPAFRLDVSERGVVSRSYAVAIGAPQFRTPIGAFRIDYMVWNPWWHPPKSEWARKEVPKAPGWMNPVGRVKMHVTDLVFLHGSPVDHSIGTAASHACIRMHNADAIELARLVVAHAAPLVSMTLLDSLVGDTARTQAVDLVLSVPIDIQYELAEVKDQTLFVYRDVYRFAGKRVPNLRSSMMAALLRSGRDTNGIRTDLVRTLTRDATRSTVRIAVDSLFAPRGTGE